MSSTLNPYSARRVVEGLNLEERTIRSLRRILDLAEPDGRVLVSAVIDEMFSLVTRGSANNAISGLAKVPLAGRLFGAENGGVRLSGDAVLPMVC
jgi:hypothetical protein